MKIVNILKVAAMSAMLTFVFCQNANATVQEDEEIYHLVSEHPTINIDGKELTTTEFMQKLMTQKTPEGCQSGRIMCQVIISSKGELKSCEVKKGLDDATNEAAVKLITTAGKWSPAKNNGKPVACSLMFVVMFR